MGIPLDRVTEEEAVEHILTACGLGQGGSVMTPNVDIVRQVVGDSDLRRLVNTATLLLADGTPLVWASRLQGDPLPGRIPGSTLIWSLSTAAAAAGASIFLLGAAPGVAARAGQALQAAIPGLIVAGHHCPPLGFENSPEEIALIMESIGASNPNIVFCGLGSFKQERLMEKLVAVFPNIWFLGTGAAIDFAAGDTTRAPLWMQKRGLEWLHRLTHEPKRLFRRYVIHDIPFALHLLVTAALSRQPRPQETAT